VGSFNQTQVGAAADKVGKDTNHRGLAIYHNVVYVTKGSGGNGIDTAYFIDTTGTACPSGVGLPVKGAPLPTAISYIPADLQTLGVYPYNMCILKGFNTISQKATNPPPFDPFGVWFANPRTLYVADEGDGSPAYDRTPSPARKSAGSRSGPSTGPSGTSSTRSRTGLTWASRTSSPVIRPAPTPAIRASRGHPPPMACATSPGAETGTER
jgi:hypothetical protein